MQVTRRLVCQSLAALPFAGVPVAKQFNVLAMDYDGNKVLFLDPNSERMLWTSADNANRLTKAFHKKGLIN